MRVHVRCKEILNNKNKATYTLDTINNICMLYIVVNIILNGTFYTAISL